MQAILSRTFPIFCFVLFLSLSAESADREISTFEHIVDLRGKWKFKTGDDLRWVDPNFNDSNWEELQVPVPWGKQGHYDYSGIAWYRLELHVPEKESRKQFTGITIGFVDSSYELYAGGRKIGRAGWLPLFSRKWNTTGSRRFEFHKNHFHRTVNFCWHCVYGSPMKKMMHLADHMNAIFCWAQSIPCSKRISKRNSASASFKCFLHGGHLSSSSLFSKKKSQ